VGFVVDNVASGQVFSPAKTVHSTNFIITITRGGDETESFMEVAKAKNLAVEPQEKKKYLMFVPIKTYPCVQILR
jgi:hypothetical protein